MPVEKHRKKSEYSAAFLLLCLSYFALWLAQDMNGTTAALCAQKLGGADAARAASAALFFAGAALSRFAAGLLVDRDYDGTAAVAGAAVFLAAVIATGAIQKLWVFVALRFFQGFGCCCAQTALVAMAAKLSPRGKTGEGMSLIGLGQALALGLSALFALSLLESGVGRLYFWSALTVGASLAFGFSAVFAGFRKGVTERRRGKHPLISRKALPASFIQLAASMASGSCLSYITLYAGTAGLNGGVYFAIAAASMLLTRFAAGKISVKRGELGLVFPAAITAAVGLGLLPVARGSGLFYLSAVLFGAGSGVIQPMLTASAIKSGVERGAATATFMLATDMGLMLGAAVWGSTMGKPGFEYIYSASSLIMMAAGIHALRLKRKSRRQVDRPPT